MTPHDPRPDVAGFDAGAARRVELTVSCRDCDSLPKVPGAGGVAEREGGRVQVMHNGVVVEEGGYFGPWMAEIIRCLRGHHEPQEELAFAKVLERLTADRPEEPTAVELGSFWAYYSLWFLNDFPDASVVAMEPDPVNLELGRRNFTHNGRSGHFVHGVIGPEPGATMTFVAEQSRQPYEVTQYDLASLMAAGGLDHVDLLLVDIQGAETLFFEQAADLVLQGCVRFAVVSTHHHSISGDPLTHEHLLHRLQELGGHVIVEHRVEESFSGDGLIVVSFDERDRDLHVPISIARQRDTLFGGSAHDLARAWAERDSALSQVADLRAVIARRDELLARRNAVVDALERELAVMRSTRVWRYAERPRRVYANVRKAASRLS